MRVLILGASGMLGHKLCQVFPERFETWGTIRRGLPCWFNASILDGTRAILGVDATAFDSVAGAIATAQPGVVVNAIGIVKQQPTARDPISSLAVNSYFPRRLSSFCRASGVRLIHFSTDCVFSGRRGAYTEDDSPDPEDLYGWSKLLGELDSPTCLTLRTSMVGRELGTTVGLLEWFLANQGGRVKGYTHAIFSGFPTLVLARIVADVIEHHPRLSGTYHVSSVPISKYDLLCLFRAAYRMRVEIDPSSEVRRDRSLVSTRFQTATGFAPPLWTDLVGQLAADPTPYDEWRHQHAA